MLLTLNIDRPPAWNAVTINCEFSFPGLIVIQQISVAFGSSVYSVEFHESVEDSNFSSRNGSSLKHYDKSKLSPRQLEPISS